MLICDTLDELLAWEASDEVLDRLSSTTPLPELADELPDRPKVLVCHDYKGGYVEDSWNGCSDIKAAYRLSHWSSIDIFVYFSHHLVSCPPTGWISAAHRHGVQVLGTFITEWDAGTQVCETAFATSEVAEECASRLAHMSHAAEFDGWLINIENDLDPKLVPNLLHFLRQLTSMLQAQHPSKQCLWYDAVTIEGTLKWQDTLNELNQAFFDACSGLFVNYCWKEETPQEIAVTAGARRTDVYLGVDTFGRGTFGGGGMNSGTAITAAQSHGVSAALFAPGWISEHGDPATFEQRQEAFWRSIRSSVSRPRPPVPATSFYSCFDQGCGRAVFEQGRCIATGSWFDLGRVSSQQPLQQRFEAGSCREVTARVVMDTAYHGGSSLHISGSVADSSYLDLLLFATFLPLQQLRHTQVHALMALTNRTDETECGLVLAMKNQRDGSQQTVLCGRHRNGCETFSHGAAAAVRHLTTEDSTVALCHMLDTSETGCHKMGSWQILLFQLPEDLQDCIVTSVGVRCWRAERGSAPATLDARIGMISIGNAHELHASAAAGGS